MLDLKVVAENIQARHLSPASEARAILAANDASGLSTEQ